MNDAAEMNAALEILKARRPAGSIEGYDLAVEHQRFAALGGPSLEGLSNFWKLRGLLVAEPRPETHASANRHIRNGADAVVLGLVDEIRVVELRVGQRSEHRLDHLYVGRGFSPGI